MKSLERWIGIALINLAIVALLGFTLRCKMLFSIPFINFKYLLHAHSHFAFGGWVTVALLALMTFQILPRQMNRRPVYKWLLTGTLLTSYGMLLSFPFEGYATASIICSTLFIFVAYAFAFVFTRDVLKTEATKSVKLLSIAAVLYAALSSVGPFTLAYLMASKSSESYLAKDAIYTYLHLQYNGFFTLAVFALLLHYLKQENKHTWRFSLLLNASIIPSMFISYLWHYDAGIVWLIAAIGCLLILSSLVVFFPMLRSLQPFFGNLQKSVRTIGAISMLAFVLKLFFQVLTIIPALSAMVFTNRPIIIGFLHLVLLGFVSLYLLAHFIQTNLLAFRGMIPFAITVFIIGVIVNELILFVQGLGVMLMMSSGIVNWLLLGAAVLLLFGAAMTAVFQWRLSRAFQTNHFRVFKQFSQS